jgi:hypothetical protein
MPQTWKWVKHLACMGVQRKADKKIWLENLNERTFLKQRGKQKSNN